MNTHRRILTSLASCALLFGIAAGNSVAQADVKTAEAADPALGIDVSNHNGQVDFGAVKKDGRNFAFILATDGDSFTSPLFDSQYRKAGEAGVFRGAYHFARPSGSATKQAEHFVKAAGYRNDGKSLPPVVDLEANPDGATCYGLDHKQMKEWVTTFVGKVKEQTQRDAIIYTSPAFWRDCAGNSEAFTANPLWTAQWGVQQPDKFGGWTDYTFWQYSNSGQVGGVNGAVDVNRFNGDASALKKLATG